MLRGFFMKKKVIYYLPIDQKFISDWEYYFDMLKDLFTDTIHVGIY